MVYRFVVMGCGSDGIRSSTEAEALTEFFIKSESRGQHWWRKGETLVRSLGGAVIHGHFW